MVICAIYHEKYVQISKSLDIAKNRGKKLNRKTLSSFFCAYIR